MLKKCTVLQNGLVFDTFSWDFSSTKKRIIDFSKFQIFSDSDIRPNLNLDLNLNLMTKIVRYFQIWKSKKNRQIIVRRRVQLAVIAVREKIDATRRTSERTLNHPYAEAT